MHCLAWSVGWKIATISDLYLLNVLVCFIVVCSFVRIRNLLEWTNFVRSFKLVGLCELVDDVFNWWNVFKLWNILQCKIYVAWSWITKYSKALKSIVVNLSSYLAASKWERRNVLKTTTNLCNRSWKKTGITLNESNI